MFPSSHKTPLYVLVLTLFQSSGSLLLAQLPFAYFFLSFTSLVFLHNSTIFVSSPSHSLSLFYVLSQILFALYFLPYFYGHYFPLLLHNIFPCFLSFNSFFPAWISSSSIHITICFSVSPPLVFFLFHNPFFQFSSLSLVLTPLFLLQCPFRPFSYIHFLSLHLKQSPFPVFFASFNHYFPFLLLSVFSTLFPFFLAML